MLVKTLCRAPETQPGASLILFFLTGNINVSGGGGEGQERDKRYPDKIINADYSVIPFVFKKGTVIWEMGIGGWGKRFLHP